MKILVVEDDAELLGLISYALRQADHLVIQAMDGTGALTLFAREQPELVILAVDLPDMSGFEVCRHMRADSGARIILLAPYADEADQVYGLDLGADDYLARPLSMRLFLARVRALVRRAASVRAAVVRYGPFVIDALHQVVAIGAGQRIPLSRLEFRLFHYLALNAEQTIPFQHLIIYVWNQQSPHYRPMLKQLVHRLRRKIEPDPAHPHYLVSVARIGYMLRGG